MARPLTVIVSFLCLAFLLCFKPLIGIERWSLYVLLSTIFLPIIVQFAFGAAPPNLYRFYPLALISLLIVHVQYYLDYLIGNVSVHNRMWADNFVVVTSLWLIAVGISSFVFSYSLTGRHIRIRTRETERIHTTKYLLIFCAMSLAVYFYTANPLYFRGYYGVENIGQTADYSALLFQASTFAYIIVRTRNAKQNKMLPLGILAYFRVLGLPFISLLALYLLSVLWSGDRGPLIHYGLCILWNYFYFSGRIPNATSSIFLLFVGAFFIMTLGELRKVEGGSAMSDRVDVLLNDGFSEEKERSIFPPTQPLAKSVRTLHTVVNYVPQSHPHTYGYFFLRKLISVIPFSGSFADALLAPKNSPMYRGTALFTTWIVYGEKYTSGEGTSAIADLYIEFGVFAVVFGMMFFGFIVRLSEKGLECQGLISILLHVVATTYFSYAVHIARGSVFVDPKFIVWTLLIIYGNRAFTKILTARRY